MFVFLFWNLYCFFAFLVPEFFVTKPTGALEALKRPLELVLTHLPCDGGCRSVDTCKERAALCLEEPDVVPHSDVHQAGRQTEPPGNEASSGVVVRFWIFLQRFPGWRLKL